MVGGVIYGMSSGDDLVDGGGGNNTIARSRRPSGVPSWQVAHCLADGRLRIVLEAYQRPPTPLSILTLRTRLLLPKVRAFVDFLQQHWMRPRPPL
jgi:DNA-binding transcriptional LysR family regulator